MSFLNGKKTYLSGGGLILAAIAGFVLGLSGNESSLAMDANTAFQTALQGLAVLGIGHKVQKLIGS